MKYSFFTALRVKIAKEIKYRIPYKLKNLIKKNFRKFHGLKKIDKKMLKYINYNNGYYIEIGAHDGIHNSNSLHYEKYKNWKGILIEPSSYFFWLLKNRGKNNKFYNCGCTEFNDIEETTIIDNGSFSFCNEIIDENDKNFYNRKNLFDKKKIYTKKKITLKTLNSILIESRAPKIIDFFSLDVEGMEIKILKGIDFKKYKFKYILVECRNKQKFIQVKDFLDEKNYNHIDNLTPWDCLFAFSN